MEFEQEPEPISEDELDALLAAEAGMSLEEFRERSDVDLEAPWNADVVADHEE